MIQYDDDTRYIIASLCVNWKFMRLLNKLTNIKTNIDSVEIIEIVDI